MPDTDPPARSSKHWKSILSPFAPLLSSGRPLGPRVLSLDGGGCRGYLTLHILKMLLREVQPEELIYPYHYFDLICGTSTGGLIAILLGVLHVDIDTAIEIYESLTRKVFSEGSSVERYIKKGAGYSSEPLAAAIDEVLQKHGGDRTLMVDRNKDNGCRVLVTTAQCDGEKPKVIPVRSYPNPEKRDPEDYDHPWTIKDAALATTAAPIYFDRHAVTMNGTKVLFEDAGANGVNNPTMLAYKECQKLSDFQGGNPVFISLGTGSAPRQPTSAFGSPCRLVRERFEVIRKLLTYATNVHEVDQQMEEMSKNSQMSYYRINPLLYEKIKLSDWNKLLLMKFIAEGHNEWNKDKFHTIAKDLKKSSKRHKGPR